MIDPYVTKRQTSRDRFHDASINFVAGAGQHGAKVQPFSYDEAIKLFYGWTYAAVMLNANACAATPLRLYVRKREGTKVFSSRPVNRRTKNYLSGRMDARPSRYAQRKAAEFRDNYEEVEESHPALELLSKTNPWMNGFDLTTLRFIYLQLTGNAYLHPIIDTARGIPGELWIMPSQWVEVIPGEIGEDEFIKGYLYGQGYNRLTFTPDEVGHFKLPNPKNMYYGMGKVEAGWNVLQRDKAAHIMDLALYQNHARPDYAIIVKSGYSDAAFQQFEQRINAKLKGPRNSGRFLTMGGDAQIVPLSWPPKDMQGREEMLEEIAVIMGVPITKLKANDPNRANAEQGDAGWMKDTILPMLRHDEERLNEWYLPLFGIEGDAFLCYDNPVPEDKIFERDTRRNYVETGLISYNEARAELGLDEVDGGDRLLVPSGKVPIEDAGKQQTSPFSGFGLSASAPEVKAPIIDEAALADKIAEKLQAMFVPYIAPKVAPEPEPKAEDAPKEVGDADDTAREAEETKPIERLRDTIGRAMISARDRIIEVITGGGKSRRKVKAPDKDLEKLIARIQAASEKITEDMAAEIADDVRAAMKPLLETGAEAGMSKADLAGTAFDVTNPEVEKFMREYTIRLAGSITNTTTDRIGRILAESLGAGDTVRNMATRIMAADGWDDEGIARRAEMIARTESARAYVQGETMAWEQSGVVEGKEWLLAPDACEFCEAAAAIFNAKLHGLREIPDGMGKGSVLAGKDGGTMTLSYEDIAGPPLHPNCRCDLMPVIVEGD